MPNETNTITEEHPSVPAEGVGEGSAVAEGAIEKVWTPLFFLIVVTALLFFVAGMGLNTGSTVYLTRTGHASWVAGVSAATFSIAAAIIRIVCGQWIDKRGRYIAVAAGSIVYAIVSLIPLVHLGSEAFLVVRIIQGIAFGTVTTTIATMASDVLPMARLGEGLGFYGLSQAIAMSIGPAIALFVVETDPAENLFLAIGIIAICACVLCLQCRYERKPDKLPKTCGYRMHLEAKQAAVRGEQVPAIEQPRRGLGEALKDVFELRALCGAIPIMLYSPIAGFCIYFVGLYASQLGLINGGVFYTLSAVAMIIVRMGSHLFMDRVAPFKILGFALLFGAASMGLLLYICSYEGDLRTLLFCIAGFCYGICNGLAMPVNQAVAVKNTPPERWGAANGLVLFTFDVGIGVASVAWGLINESFGYATTLALCIAFLALTFASAFFLFPKDWGRK